MMQKFELRFWDVVTPMLTVLQGQVFRLRRPTGRKITVIKEVAASLTQTDQHTFLRASVFAATCGFLTGTIFYLVLFAATRF